MPDRAPLHRHSLNSLRFDHPDGVFRGRRCDAVGVYSKSSAVKRPAVWAGVPLVDARRTSNRWTRCRHFDTVICDVNAAGSLHSSSAPRQLTRLVTTSGGNAGSVTPSRPDRRVVASLPWVDEWVLRLRVKRLHDLPRRQAIQLQNAPDRSEAVQVRPY